MWKNVLTQTITADGVEFAYREPGAGNPGTPVVFLIHPGAVLGKLVAALPASTLFVVTYTNADSLPARMMRRHWPPFFDHKVCFFVVLLDWLH